MSSSRVSTATDQSGGPQVIHDDKVMIRTAFELTRDLHLPRPVVYWTDLILSAGIGYSAMAVAVRTTSPAVAAVSATVSALALYRGVSFIHEITHIKDDLLKGFRLGYNVLIGVPILIPSFMYEGVHSLHHSKTRYGTVEDPEYLPFARMNPGVMLGSVALAALAPVGLVLRFGVLTPVSYLSPSFRRTVLARFTALSINPQFRRQLVPAEMPRSWKLTELAASAWAVTVIFLIASGAVSLHTTLIIFLITSAIAVINQIRTLTAHLWESDGSQLSVTAQYLDSTNFPPPSLLPALWAPVGLRYHALHHLLPSLPYHSLASAHRRLTARLNPDSPYHRASYYRWSKLLKRIVSFQG